MLKFNFLLPFQRQPSTAAQVHLHLGGVYSFSSHLKRQLLPALTELRAAKSGGGRATVSLDINGHEAAPKGGEGGRGEVGWGGLELNLGNERKNQ